MLKHLILVYLILYGYFYSPIFSPLHGKDAYAKTELPSTAKSIENLHTFEWKNRIILINESSTCLNDISLLEQAEPEIKDRHIIWFALCSRSAKTITSNYIGDISDTFITYLKQYYFFQHNSKQRAKVILIGKDTEIKYMTEVLTLDIINQRIDAMPMRRAEIAEQKNNIKNN